MGSGRVVEEARERAQHVVVVVEDLVVVAARARVALHEDRVRSVDHDLPDVVVDEERCQRAVAAAGCGARGRRRSQGLRLEIGWSPRWKSTFQRSTSSTSMARNVSALWSWTSCALRAVLHPALDLERAARYARPARGRSSYRVGLVSVQCPRLPGVTRTGCSRRGRRSAHGPRAARRPPASPASLRARGAARPPLTASSTARRRGDEDRRGEAGARRRTAQPSEHRQRPGDRGPLTRSDRGMVHDGHDAAVDRHRARRRRASPGQGCAARQ